MMGVLGRDGKVVIGSDGASKSSGLCEHQLVLNCITVLDTKLGMRLRAHLHLAENLFL